MGSVYGSFFGQSRSSYLTIGDISTGAGVFYECYSQSPVTSDAQYLLAGPYDDPLHMLDIQTGTEIAHGKLAEPVAGFSVPAAGGRLIAIIRELSNGSWSGVEIAEWSPDFKVRHLGPPNLTFEMPGLLGFSPDARRLLSCGGDGIVRMWEVETGREIWHKELKNVNPYQFWNRIHYSPDKLCR